MGMRRSGVRSRVGYRPEPAAVCPVRALRWRTARPHDCAAARRHGSHPPIWCGAASMWTQPAPQFPTHLPLLAPAMPAPTVAAPVILRRMSSW